MNKKKTFTLLLIAQSLGAFGDNAVFAVIMGVLIALVRTHDMTLAQFGVASAVYANCLFIPFVLGAPIVGWLSDRFTKKNILVSANLVKTLGAAIGLAGFLSGADLMIVSYLTIGIGAAVYSPSKYGIIPELKSEEELVKANAAVEMTTIVAILTGIVGGGLLVDNLGATASFFALTLLYFSAALLNFFMDNTNRYDREERIGALWTDFSVTLKSIFASRLLVIPVLGTAIFWSSAAFVKLNLQTWGQDVLKLATATGISLLALWLSVGIILGSFLAGRVFRTGQLRQSWLFGFSMGALVLVMIGAYVNYGIVMVELIALGAAGGLFLIPLNAAVQARSPGKRIGTVIAIQNFFENSAMLASTVLFWYLNRLALSSTATFAVVGIFLCVVCAAFLKPLLRDFHAAPLEP